MSFLHLALLLSFLLLFGSVQSLRNAVRGKKCSTNQVVNKLTVYEDGAIEAECGPLPCGGTGVCAEDLSSCKAASEIFSGMKWAHNGQSLLLRCCALHAANKVYIGTDLVTMGSYYTGGVVPEKDMMGGGGTEYDFVANARTEQGGVRVWVYRIVCGGQQQQKAGVGSKQQDQQQAEGQQPKFAEVQDAQVESRQSAVEPDAQSQGPAAAAGGGAGTEEGEEQLEAAAQNPLQYRPRINGE